MKHDYTDDEIKQSRDDAMNAEGWKNGVGFLRAFLAALPERPQARPVIAQSYDTKVYYDYLHHCPPSKPGTWPGQQEAIDAAFLKADQTWVCAYEESPDWSLHSENRLAIAQAYDKARPQAAEIAELKEELAAMRESLESKDRVHKQDTEHLESRLYKAEAELAASRESESIAPSMQLQRLACEKGNKDAIQEVQKYASTLTVDGINGLLKAIQECLPETQSILADDGRSLGQVAFDAGNAVQKIKFPEQEIETWEESAEVHEMIEAAAQAVAAVVLAQAVRRMEAVMMEELSRIWRHESSRCYRDSYAVCNRLIAAAKGESPPVVVNEPPKSEGQPDLSGEGEKQTEEPAWIPHNGGPCPLKDEEVEEFEFKIRKGGVSGNVSVPSAWRWINDGTAGDIIAYRVLRWKPGFGPEAKAEPAQPEPAQPWTPAVGDTVRLKSGGPVMTVQSVGHEVCCVWACSGEVQWTKEGGAGNSISAVLATTNLPAACLTPAQP